MIRQKNDDTLTKLGDIFHYLIVLEHCLDLKENEIIVVERYGDLSIESTELSKNMEVKNHIKQKNFLDRDVEFWKTLKNWMENYRDVKRFNKLILLTTSDVKETSPFYKWNKLKPMEKLEVIKNIGEDEKSNERIFRGLYKKVFVYPENQILELLGKIELNTSEIRVSERIAKIKKHPIFKLINEIDSDAFIQELLGYILTHVVNPPYIWEITEKDFKRKAIEVRDRFSNTKRPLPNLFEDKNPPSYTTYEDKHFVKAIEEIEYLDEIEEAIGNYWRMSQTIIMYFQDNPIYLRDIEEYKNDLEKKVTRLKKKSMRNCKEKEHVIEKSQDFYDDTMLMDSKSFGTIDPNRDYFQHGIIHTIVNEKKVNWKLGDNNGD